MNNQESLQEIFNLRLRFQMNSRLRLESLAALSRLFREHDEDLNDELLATMVFALPAELPGERPDLQVLTPEAKKPGTQPPQPGSPGTQPHPPQPPSPQPHPPQPPSPQPHPPQPPPPQPPPPQPPPPRNAATQRNAGAARGITEATESGARQGQSSPRSKDQGRLGCAGMLSCSRGRSFAQTGQPPVRPARGLRLISPSCVSPTSPGKNFVARELKRPAHRRAEFHHSEFQEEARQVFSIPLYDAKSCAEIVEYVKGLDDWSSALVRFEAGHKEYVTAERPDDRIAKILGPAQTSRSPCAV